MNPETLFARGFTEIISVSPPNAQLAPSSKISGSMLGKVPARRLSSGLYVGYDWRRYETTAEDAAQWARDGANIGLRADRWPAVDIDSLDPGIAKIVEDVALAQLGPAPVRVGQAPKRLLMYRTSEPFGRMRLIVKHGDKQSLIEILGAGQQYLVAGTHPKTLLPYSWSADITPESLTEITREKAAAFFAYLAEMLDMLGIGTVTRQGDGRVSSGVAGEQSELRAPSLDTLREAVQRIPNTNAVYPDRDSYINMGYAIKAAGGEEALEIFAEWAAKWEGNGSSPNGNDPDVVLADWRRMHGPYKIGWGWIAETARAYGYNDAATEFEAEPLPGDEPVPPLGSDQWLAGKVVDSRSSELRFVPASGKFLVWDRSRWVPDAELLADDIIKQELRVIADKVARHGATEKEKKEAHAMGMAICSAYRVSAVRTLIQSDRAIAVRAEVLDHDPWLLNTPAGMVDLKAGALLPPDPDKLCTRSTAVAPDFGAATPEWTRFLAEATGGDVELQAYLQRLAGYALTGVTYEQHLTFIYGRGGNGKGTFLNALAGILHDYHQQAAMTVFTAQKYEQHTTELADLAGARLVVASETEAGKRWNEQRITSLTGGDPIKARFMRQDNFTYVPQFKLVFAGNHKPELRDITPALKRRIHMVPFTIAPAVRDGQLGEKLRAEWPGILAWMVRGCLAWQQDGLAPPQSVQDLTAEYFRDQDAFGRWREECCDLGTEHTALTAALYDSWREWANRNGEFVGTMRRFSSTLASMDDLEKWRDPATRRHGFRGIGLKPMASEFSLSA